MTVKVGSKTGIVIKRVSRDVIGGRGEGQGEGEGEGEGEGDG